MVKVRVWMIAKNDKKTFFMSSPVQRDRLNGFNFQKYDEALAFCENETHEMDKKGKMVRRLMDAQLSVGD